MEMKSKKKEGKVSQEKVGGHGIHNRSSNSNYSYGSKSNSSSHNDFRSYSKSGTLITSEEYDKNVPTTGLKSLKSKQPKATNSEMQKNPKRKTKSDSDWSWTIFIIIAILGILTRFHKVEEPDHVCWDETHFGKMGSWYINRTFFFDVHPPLGKMMVGLFGYMTGYDGTFPFESPGQKYNETRYLGMRLCCTTLGSLLVPLSYLTVWEMTGSTSAACLAASFILFDVGLLTLTQYILLDPILLFFISGSIYSSFKFYSYRERPFSPVWWIWLSSTGIFITCAISVKFVGLFTVLFICLRTIVELWEILGDISRPITYTMKHFLARALCLIFLPTILYISFFYVHFTVLNRSGNGDGFYSSGFQSQLIGNPLYNASMPREVAYGAHITIKSQRTGGGYLHSHWHLYPEGIGARQQQITTYAHKDENNKWIIKKFNEEVGKLDDKSVPIDLVRSGDMVRLEHIITRRNLHSHRVPAPVSKKLFQTTGYGESGIGDANDIWRIEVVGGKPGDLIAVVSSRIRFYHQLQNCVLTGTGKQLPKWAYEQMEVACSVNLRDVRKNTYWNVEENHFPKLPNVSFQVHAPGFIEKFVESHTIMFEGNAGLKPKEGEVTSRPWQWPINYRGQYFSGNNYRVYLLGNPIIWWANIILLLIFGVVYVFHLWRCQRGIIETPEILENRGRIVWTCGWLCIGWGFHYFPFYTMGRVLYFHHYFPALLFSSMLSGVVVDYLFRILSNSIGKYFPTESLFQILQGIFLATIVYSFYIFSPLAYGASGPLAIETNSSMHGLKWLDTWEF